MQPERPRPSRVVWRAFEFVFWTTLFLFILLAALYLLAPAFSDTYKSNPDTLHLYQVIS